MIKQCNDKEIEMIFELVNSLNHIFKDNQNWVVYGALVHVLLTGLIKAGYDKELFLEQIIDYWDVYKEQLVDFKNG